MEDIIMAKITIDKSTHQGRLDATGLKCPEPILKLAAASADFKKGTILEVLGDCSTFEEDIRQWCARVNKKLLWIKDENGKKRCQIQF
jgi:TusA-related sulfurtransferase